MQSAKRIIPALALAAASLWSASALATAIPLSSSRTCPKGGTSTMTGSYDTVTGQVSMTSTMSQCTLWNGEVQNGSTTLTGTILPGTGSLVNIDLSTTETASVTRNTSSLTHTCTATKKGTFDQSTRLFTGQSSSNCSNDGVTHDAEGLAEYLLRRAAVLPAPAATPTPAQ